MPSTGGPVISVLVVNYNAGEHLRRCIAQLAAQTFTAFEALILDNGSTDGSFASARAAIADDRFRFVDLGGNLGFAAANNRGADMASGRWIACLNPDAFAEADWLAELMAATTRHPGAGMFASLQRDAADPRRLDGMGDCYHAFGLAWRGGYGRLVPESLREEEVFGACAAAALYDRAFFLACGGFDETFFCYFEDVDLAFRWRLAGGACVFVPNAVVDHLGSAISSTISGFARYHGTRNAVWCFVKNMPGPLLWLCLPAHAALMLALLASAWRKGQAKTVGKALADAISGIPRRLADRRKVQALKTRSVLDVARMLHWNPISLLRRPHCPLGKRK